jgi:hypothetical protein
MSERFGDIDHVTLSLDNAGASVNRALAKMIREQSKEGQVKVHSGRDSLLVLFADLPTAMLCMRAIQSFLASRRVAGVLKISANRGSMIVEGLREPGIIRFSRGWRGRPIDDDIAIGPIGESNTLEYTDKFMGDATARLEAVAADFGLPVDVAKQVLMAAAAELTARENTARAPAKPRRLKWDTDRRPDENPAAFAWRAYAAEAEAGTLHRGVIGKEDKPLAVKLASWLRTHDMPEGIDIPTKPEWNTRQIEAGKAKRAAAPPPRTEGQRLYDVAVKRRRARTRDASL